MAERRRYDLGVWYGAIVFLVAISAYVTKPDALAAWTIWPFWVTLLAGVLPSALSVRRKNLKPRCALWSAWLVAWAAIGDEAMPLARSLVAPRSGELRVVTLNCAGSLDAGLEVVAYAPDVVLLQESMGADALEQIRARLGNDWTVVVGVDASILARGELVTLAQEPNYSAARLGGTVIVSLRLAPPVFRLDYWNPACWRAYAGNKRRRRSELAGVLASIRSFANGAPVILGGDFNTPPDHTVLGQMSGTFEDAFAIAGRSWGATAVNSFPMVRIDQVWASPELTPTNAFAVKTIHSDHQMTVADFDH